MRAFNYRNPYREKRTHDFSWTTDHEPTHDEVVMEQIRRAYHPGGYGGPNNVNTTKTETGFVTTWSCNASCD